MRRDVDQSNNQRMHKMRIMNSHVRTFHSLCVYDTFCCLAINCLILWNKFWSWFHPNTWVVLFNAKVRAKHVFNFTKHNFTISTKIHQSCSSYEASPERYPSPRSDVKRCPRKETQEQESALVEEHSCRCRTLFALQCLWFGIRWFDNLLYCSWFGYHCCRRLPLSGHHERWQEKVSSNLFKKLSFVMNLTPFFNREDKWTVRCQKCLELNWFFLILVV